jgi:hypothetical protein
MADSRAIPTAHDNHDDHDTQDKTVRNIADWYVDALTELDPILATALGVRSGEDRLPDFSPAGQQAADDLARKTLGDLGTLTGELSGDERRCGRLLRERGRAVPSQGRVRAGASAAG